MRRHTTLSLGQGYTSVEMKLNYVRPIVPELGEVVCEGVVVHRGGTLATSEGRLFDAKGRLLAHGTETCMIFEVAARARRPDGADDGARGERYRRDVRSAAPMISAPPARAAGAGTSLKSA